MNAKRADLLVGLFVIAGITGIFAVGLYLARTGRAEQTVPYAIHFEESVAGLSVGSRVSYRGIRIGSVGDIGIMEEQPQFVRVIINVNDKYRLRRGDVAILRPEGITGNSYINIEGAQAGSPVVKTSRKDPALIPSRKSELEQLVRGGPDLINEATTLANRLSDVLNRENRDQLQGILKNLNSLTSTLAAEEEHFKTMLASVTEAGQEAAALSRSLEKVAERLEPVLSRLSTTIDTADSLLGTDAKKLIGDWEQSARSLEQAADSARQLITANQEPINAFARDGLFEFTLFLQEARQLVASMTRVFERLEASGARFLLDQQTPEIQPE